MFQSLSTRLQDALRSLRGEARLTEASVDAALREIRLALLEADVNFKVAKAFVDRVRVRAVDREVLRSLTPAQQVVKIVRDEMIALFGVAAGGVPGAAPALGCPGGVPGAAPGSPTRHPRWGGPPALGCPDGLQPSTKTPRVIALLGLQGSGKTTTAAKLGKWLTRQGRHPLLVSTDVRRPAAIEQLSVLGQKAGLRVHDPNGEQNPIVRATGAVALARNLGFDVVIVDTAGRLHIDDELMGELEAIKSAIDPVDRLYVADAMTGQDAIKSAGEFNRRIGVTGVVLTKVDGDARGGAALSVVSVVGVPIAFTGTGERLEDFEPFHADRLVSRILGMGDVMSLIERAGEAIDQEEAERLAEQTRLDDFTLENFRDQLRAVRKMGPFEQLLGLLPGMGDLKDLAQQKPDEKQLSRIEAIIDSMTREERRNHHIINGSCRKRISRGSGTKVEEVNRLLKQFVQMRKLFKTLGGMAGIKKNRRRAMQMLQSRTS